MFIVFYLDIDLLKYPFFAQLCVMSAVLQKKVFYCEFHAVFFNDVALNEKC